jgi:hypothetical protein
MIKSVSNVHSQLWIALAVIARNQGGQGAETGRRRKGEEFLTEDELLGGR